MSTGVALPTLTESTSMAVRSGAAYLVNQNKVMNAEKYVRKRRLDISLKVAINVVLCRFRASFARNIVAWQAFEIQCLCG